MKEKKKVKIIFILGPTATGKTSLAVKLAGKFDGEIISADSRQVYKGLDIGSGKDIREYGNIPFHMIDIVNPSEEYNLMRYRNEAPEAILNICARGRLPIVTGGSALYMDSILSDYSLPGQAPEPQLRTVFSEMKPEDIAERLENETGKAGIANDKKNKNRLVRSLEIAVSGGFSAKPLPFEPEFLVIGVYYPRKMVHQRIEQRLDDRLGTGMVEEVQRLHDQGIGWDRLEFFGLEYRYLAYYLQGKMGFADMRQKLLEKIRQFAKRQDIWFRKMEREGHVIHWIRDGDFNKASVLIELFLSGKELPCTELSISEIYYGKKTS